MPKQNITVNRYASDRPSSFPWEASIHPEDESWVLFVPRASHPDVKPQLWFACGKHVAEDGTEEVAYLPAPGSADGPCVVPECDLPEGEAMSKGEVTVG